MKWLALLLIMPLVLSGCTSDPETQEEPQDVPEDPVIQDPVVNETEPEATVNETEPGEVPEDEPEEEPEPIEEEEQAEVYNGLMSPNGLNFEGGALRYTQFQLNESANIYGASPESENWEGLLVIVSEAEFAVPDCADLQAAGPSVFVITADTMVQSADELAPGRYHAYGLHTGSEPLTVSFNATADADEFPLVSATNGTFTEVNVDFPVSGGLSGSGSATGNLFVNHGLVFFNAAVSGPMTQYELTASISTEQVCAASPPPNEIPANFGITRSVGAYVPPLSEVTVQADFSSGPAEDLSGTATAWVIEFA